MPWSLPFRRRPPPAAAAAHASLPAGLRVYAIGDVHGRDDLLAGIEQRVRAEEARRGAAAEPLVVMLGDLVDRGPSSRAVIERLAGGRLAGLPVRALLGNHEEALLDFLADPAAAAGWLDWGGRETLASYGVAVDAAPRPGDLRRLAADLAERMPAGHLAFLRDLELCIELGGFVFAHAGIRPGIPLARQRRQDLVGIRSPFLEGGGTFGHRVVHGHTIADAVEILPHRIGVDTGAYRTGRLGAVVIEGADVGILG